MQLAKRFVDLCGLMLTIPQTDAVPGPDTIIPGPDAVIPGSSAVSGPDTVVLGAITGPVILFILIFVT